MVKVIFGVSYTIYELRRYWFSIECMMLLWWLGGGYDLSRVGGPDGCFDFLSSGRRVLEHAFPVCL